MIDRMIQMRSFRHLVQKGQKGSISRYVPDNKLQPRAGECYWRTGGNYKMAQCLIGSNGMVQFSSNSLKTVFSYETHRTVFPRLTIGAKIPRTFKDLNENL